MILGNEMKIKALKRYNHLFVRILIIFCLPIDLNLIWL